MALAAAFLTSWDGLTSGSISPTANALILVAVGFYQTSADPTPPTGVSGNGITYTKIGDSPVFTSSSGVHRKLISLWRGMSASPSAGALTITGGTAAFSAGAVAEVTGVDTGGTNGADAVVQFDASSKVDDPPGASSLAATLAAFGSVNNGVFGVGYVMGFASAAYTPEGGYTELFDGFAADRPMLMWRADNDTSPSFSWTGTDSGAIVALELKLAGGAPAVSDPTIRVPNLRPRIFAPGRAR